MNPRPRAPSRHIGIAIAAAAAAAFASGCTALRSTDATEPRVVPAVSTAPGAGTEPAVIVRPTLVGFARLDAETWAEGPTSGRFVAPANGVVPPFESRVPVQGFSSVIPGPRTGTFRVLVDNGFATRANSPDVVLRAYAVRPGFRTAAGGTGRVVPVGFDDGRRRRSFDAGTWLALSDPERRLGYPAIADAETYPYAGTGPGAPGVAVDPGIRAHRLLTGGDLDPEEFARDARGRYWFGDEFGPFLVVADARGRLLAPPVAVPVPPPLAGAPDAPVRSPQNPLLAGARPNARASAGIEALAIPPGSPRLYAMLEAALVDDPDPKRLPLYEFDTEAMRFTGQVKYYRLAAEGTSVGGMAAFDAHRFVVIERDSTQGDPNEPARFPTPARHKKLYLVDLRATDAEGFLVKRELADLLDVADPDDLDRDGRTRYTMPFVTIESVAVVDARTLLVINDNNFPGNGGRTTTAPEATEFALIRLPASP